MKLVLLFLFISSACAREQPILVNEVLNNEQVIDEIYMLMQTLMDLKYFDFGSIPTFFPLEGEFFDVLFLLQKIEVEQSSVAKLREITSKEVRVIQDLFFNHSSGITDLINLLSETSQIIQSKENSAEKLSRNWRSILRLATGSVSQLMTIIEKVEVHSAQFQYRVEKLIKTAKKVDMELVDKIRQRIFEITADYSEIYEELFILLGSAHEQFDTTMPAIQTYIDLLSDEYQLKTVQ